VLALDLRWVSWESQIQCKGIMGISRTLAFLEIGIVVRDRFLVLYCGGWIDGEMFLRVDFLT
jgi:hypothetical protein